VCEAQAVALAARCVSLPETQVYAEKEVELHNHEVTMKEKRVEEQHIMQKEKVDHPSHYGGGENPYEHVKVALALGWDRNAFIYNCTKYLWRSGGNYVGLKNGAAPLEDLRKARWYLDRAIERETSAQSVLPHGSHAYQGSGQWPGCLICGVGAAQPIHDVKEATCEELGCSDYVAEHSPYCRHAS